MGVGCRCLLTEIPYGYATLDLAPALFGCERPYGCVARSVARAEGARRRDARVHLASATHSISRAQRATGGHRRVSGWDRPGSAAPRLSLRHFQDLAPKIQGAP